MRPTFRIIMAAAAIGWLVVGGAALAMHLIGLGIVCLAFGAAYVVVSVIA